MRVRTRVEDSQDSLWRDARGGCEVRCRKRKKTRACRKKRKKTKEKVAVFVKKIQGRSCWYQFVLKIKDEFEKKSVYTTYTTI